TRVVLAEATGFDLDARAVRLGDLANGEEQRALEYDALVVAGGSAYSYFGHDDWARFAPELKSLGGALDLRSRILSAFQASDGEVTTVAARTAVWAAGVTASPLARLLADAAGLETDSAGRLPVEPDLTLPGHPDVHAIGDMVAVRDLPLPGVAPVAMQQG